VAQTLQKRLVEGLLGDAEDLLEGEGADQRLEAVDFAWLIEMGMSQEALQGLPALPSARVVRVTRRARLRGFDETRGDDEAPVGRYRGGQEAQGIEIDLERGIPPPAERNGLVHAADLRADVTFTSGE